MPRITFGRGVMAAFVTLALLLQPARAGTLAEAYDAYVRKDYPVAFAKFSELGELGLPLAQRNLAIMHFNGEGTPKSMGAAYAWASLAVDSGQKDAATVLKAARSRLSDEDLKKAAAIQASFGPEALEKKLMPQLAGERRPDQGSCRGKIPVSNYPVVAQMQGIQGNVMVEYIVMPDGRTRMPRIVYAIPQGVFEEAVRWAVLHAQYTPGRFDGVAAPCMQTMFFRFALSGSEGETSNDFDRFRKATLTKAEAGDPGAQTVYGLLIAGMPAQMKQERQEALPWFLKAAQAGAPLAQYQVGYSMLKGWGCLCEEPKGLFWLRKAAEADQADAQLVLAQYSLRDSSGEGGVIRAKTWLERAVAGGNRDAKLYLAALLAAAPAAEARDPKRSLALIRDIYRDVNDDPTTFQIRAAALAHTGDFKAAVLAQKKALHMAEKLGWDLAPDTERLALYQSSQAWTGNLLPF